MLLPIPLWVEIIIWLCVVYAGGVVVNLLFWFVFVCRADYKNGQSLVYCLLHARLRSNAGITALASMLWFPIWLLIIRRAIEARDGTLRHLVCFVLGSRISRKWAKDNGLI